ncbi:putative amidoligase domain-containing protein [Ferroacidibacillus organovorans]|uniref:Phage phiEco32-like COOH-NH2 ligase-type 2 n=1 Tax=Ferroacidibacillus organovorans TaxID=1765683 RepID=A0A1V4ERR0_9BACL|nr:hypothetical protein [Ferroacidibacillus organovorans]OPG15607.1 hypothetical protein B2M26_11140 [Ferroacidibacillus organovorans]
MSTYLLHQGQASARRLVKRVPGLIGIREVRGHVQPTDRLIRYVGGEEPDAGAWVINRRAAFETASQRKRMAERLKMTGVRLPKYARSARDGWQAPLTRHYRIPVFGLRALACFRTDQKTVWLSQRVREVVDSMSEIPLDFDEQAGKVCQLAVRATHALGLEMSLVSIGVTPRGMLVVLDVSPAPVMQGRILEVFAQAIHEWIEQRETAIDPARILLGTDLEFMLRGKKGKMVLASRFFPLKGVVGCDDRSFGGDRMKHPLAEVRPAPAATPERLCENVRQTLYEAAGRFPHEFPQWIAGCAPFERFPTGGHIHMSGVPFHGRLVHLLDVYVGLPLMLIEDPMSSVRRRPRYGFLGDVRHKPHGGFEYRTPGSFLVDPVIAMCAFALAHIVIHHQQELVCHPLYEDEMTRAFYKNDRDTLLPMARAIYSSLRRTTAYERFQDVIDPVFEMIERDEVWDENVDVRDAWGVREQAESRARTTAS